MRSPFPQYALKKVLAQQSDWHGARVSFLAHFIIALFQVKTVNLAELATAFNGRVKPESNYKRLQRFLRGFELNFEPLARLVVSLMPLDGGRWYLTLDRTNWRFGHHEINILMLGITYRGVAVPVMWTLLSKAGNSNTAERIALIERLEQPVSGPDVARPAQARRTTGAGRASPGVGMFPAYCGPGAGRRAVVDPGHHRSARAGGVGLCSALGNRNPFRLLEIARLSLRRHSSDSPRTDQQTHRSAGLGLRLGLPGRGDS
jgi:hypothetical protein